MILQSALALGVGALVALPLLAHRRRKRDPKAIFFPAVQFVEAAKTPTRHQKTIEDRPLFAARAAAILALALLGSTPFARCNTASLGRHGGASVAIALIVDGSASMQAASKGRGTRFEVAHSAAKEMLEQLREGDNVYLITASRPPRVLAGGDVAAAREALDRMTVSDAPSDLPSALAVASSLVENAPQQDRRVLLYSDLCDGATASLPFPDGKSSAEAAPTLQASPSAVGSASTRVSYTLATEGLVAPFRDCAILRADYAAGRIALEVACSDDAMFAHRKVALVTAEGKLLDGGIALPTVVGTSATTGTKAHTVPVTLAYPAAAPGAEGDAFTARLIADGDAVKDAIVSNDEAPLLAADSEPALAVVTATEEGASATAIPVVLQALRALESDADQRANILVRPLPSIPERADELRSFRGLVIDDPPGFSPEQRRALAGFVEGGGVLLLGLGPSAARGRLGQTFEPWIMHPMAFGPTPVPGVAPPVTGESAPDRASSAMALSPWEGFERSGMEALGARGRVTFAPTDRQLFATVGPWADGEPLIAHRTIGLGELFVTTLPFSTDTSDFPLRPAFLDLLDKVRTATLGHASPRRTVAGTRWSLGADVVSVGRFSRGAKSVPEEILPREAGASGPSVAPTHLGAYDVVRRLSSCKGDGASDSTGCQQTERRVVAPSLDEIGPAPRPLPEGISGMKGASAAAQTDVSWMVALGVLGLVALELLLRLFARFPSAEGALAAEGALPIPSPTADKE